MYDQGAFIEHFHEHIPVYRISKDNSLAAMMGMVLAWEGAKPHQVLRRYLNRRSNDPASEDHHWQIHVEYPEPGVLRTYCGTDIQAWMDAVISPAKFRKT